MTMRRTAPRETPGVSGACPVPTAPSPTALQTTLYDLMAALRAEVGPDEDDVVTATVVHLLQTHRVTDTGNQARYRLVWEGTGCPAWSSAGEARHPRQGARHA